MNKPNSEKESGTSTSPMLSICMSTNENISDTSLSSSSTYDCSSRSSTNFQCTSKSPIANSNNSNNMEYRERRCNIETTILKNSTSTPKLKSKSTLQMEKLNLSFMKMFFINDALNSTVSKDSSLSSAYRKEGFKSELVSKITCPHYPEKKWSQDAIENNSFKNNDTRFKYNRTNGKKTPSLDHTEQSCISRNYPSFVTAYSSSSSIDTRLCKHSLCNGSKNSNQTKDKKPFLTLEKLKKVLQSYTHMVRFYRPLLQLVESSISKILLYRTPTLKSADENIYLSNLQSEICFVLLNLVSFVNNIIYYGIGDHQSGFTLSNNLDTELGNTERAKASLPLVLCLFLSSIDCIQPAVESVAISSNLQNHLRNHNYDPRLNYEQQKLVMKRESHPWNTIVRLEMIKSILRIMLLIHYHYRYYFVKKKYIRIMKDMPFGILEAGGVFSPGENDNVSSSSYFAKLLNENIAQELYEVRRETSMNGYIGRRTGWNGINDLQKNENKMSLERMKTANNVRKASTIFQRIYQKWMQYVNVVISSRCMIQCLTMTGDLLHILRPLYYARMQHHHHYFLTSARYQNSYRPRRQKFKTISPLRCWIISLLIDLVSQKMIYVGLRLLKNKNLKQFYQKVPTHTTITNELSFISRRTNDELVRRKQRLILYLLRSPIWYTITEPVLLRFIDKVLGIRIGQYIRGIATYWQQHHFMLD